CLSRGLDITKELVPVAPAAHYMMGGVRTNVWGESSIPGLFAAGEVACTGVHGANRLASNSMLEVVVFSKRIVEKTRGNAPKKTPDAKKNNDIRAALSERFDTKGAPPGFTALQKLMWENVGVIRNKEGLTHAADTLATWQRMLPDPTDRPSYELHHLILTARLVTEAALLREESRGAHFRSDFPQHSAGWQRHIIFTSEQANA
ncbi:MAG: FAD-binding protein, partial [Dehalococcoidales bacterium]|nr:FAD-binding protein [Dehalococcoidales bacterium]